jgi:S1-C subfamily serine protease
LSGAEREFLLDAPVFPGNSGGPVFVVPNERAGHHSPTAYLMGIVAYAINYQDTAVSQQTSRPRVYFEENSGLSAAYPIDCVADALVPTGGNETTATPAAANPMPVPPAPAAAGPPVDQPDR